MHVFAENVLLFAFMVYSQFDKSNWLTSLDVVMELYVLIVILSRRRNKTLQCGHRSNWKRAKCIRPSRCTHSANSTRKSVDDLLYVWFESI